MFLLIVLIVSIIQVTENLEISSFWPGGLFSKMSNSGSVGAATFLPIALFQLKNRLHDQKFNHYFIQLKNNKLFHGNV